MSFTNDSRPDTRRLAVWLRILNLAPTGAFFLVLAVWVLVPEEVRYEHPWSDVTTLLLTIPLASLIGWFVVRRAKKNADARWALAQSRTGALAAQLAEPAAR